MIANRSGVHRVLRRAREAGRATLSAVQSQMLIRMVGSWEGVELAVAPGSPRRTPSARDLALELPERIALADERRLMLFFDEFQEVAAARRPYGDPMP